MGMVTKMIEFNTTFPHLQLEDLWPRNRSASGTIIGCLMVILCVVLGSIFLVAVPFNAGLPAVIGAGGFSLLMFTMALLFLHRLGSLMPRRNSGVLHEVDSMQGPGVELKVKRINDLLISLALAGCSIYGFCAWLDWRSGGDSLLPLSKANTGGAIFILGVSVVCAVMLLFTVVVFRYRITVHVFQTGILRRVPIPFQEKEQFVSWDDIETLVATTFSSGNATNIPIIEANLKDGSAARKNRMFDRTGVFGIPVHLTVPDPNVSYAIIKFLKETPEQRYLVASPNIDQWVLELEERNKMLRRKQPDTEIRS